MSPAEKFLCTTNSSGHGTPGYSDIISLAELMIHDNLPIGGQLLELIQHDLAEDPDVHRLAQSAVWGSVSARVSAIRCTALGSQYDKAVEQNSDGLEVVSLRVQGRAVRVWAIHALDREQSERSCPQKWPWNLSRQKSLLTGRLLGANNLIPHLVSRDTRTTSPCVVKSTNSGQY